MARPYPNFNFLVSWAVNYYMNNPVVQPPFGPYTNVDEVKNNLIAAIPELAPQFVGKPVNLGIYAVAKNLWDQVHP